MAPISNKVVMVAIYPDLTKKQVDGDQVKRRVNAFIDAIRKVCAEDKVFFSEY